MGLGIAAVIERCRRLGPRSSDVEAEWTLGLVLGILNSGPGPFLLWTAGRT